MPSFLILVPLFLIIAINLPIKDIMRKVAFYLAAILFLLQIVYIAFQPAFLANISADPFKPFFVFNFLFDSLSAIMLLIIGVVETAALIAGNYLIEHEKLKFKFINLLLILLIGMNAVVMAKDLFSLYIFIEITSVASFILIAIKKDLLGLEGAFKYLLLSAIASVLMLSSISLVLLVSGGLSFEMISGSMSMLPSSLYIKLAVTLFLCGAFIKSGLVPFHFWVPDAYQSAPTYVSMLLAGIITKVSGVYVLMRICISVFGTSSSLNNLLMFLGALSIIVGALLALKQDNMKRMLAYSSISQIGYIILALGCATPLAILGAVFHFFNHAISKTLLFINASALERKLDISSMDNMQGVASVMPWTGFTSVIGSLSTAGIPPLSGFWSKFMIIFALWISGNKIYASIALLASVITLAYFLMLQRRIFFGKTSESVKKISEASIALVFPSAVLAFIIIAVGLLFPWFLNGFIVPIQTIFPGSK